jgi:hypothetical protein
MTDLAGLKARVLNLLGESSEGRFGAATLQEALRQALAAYNQNSPQMLESTLTLATGGREQALSGLTAPLFIHKLVQPAQEPNSEVPFQFFVRAGQPVMVIGGDEVPQAGAVYGVEYASAHTVKDLDGAAATSLPAMHEGLLVRGAAGFAALIRQAQISEAHGGRTADGSRLEALGRGWLVDFQAALAGVKATTQLHEYPAGFRLDVWDGKE